MAVAAPTVPSLDRKEKAETARWDRWTLWVLVLFPLVYAGVGQVLGQDADWDLQNYHYFDSYWLLTNHLRDTMPAQLETYLSPILDVPFYLSVGHLPPRLIGAVLAVIQGLSFPLLYLINRHFTTRRLVALALAGLGMFTAGAISELGMIIGDTLLTPALLAAILLGLQSYDRAQDSKTSRANTGKGSGVIMLIVGASALAGLAAGLKLAELPVALGIAAAFPLVSGRLTQRILKGVWAGLALLAGCLVTYGWWAYELTIRYGNPILPFMNNIFHSSYAPPTSNRGTYVGAASFFSYPFIWTVRPSALVDDISFRELSLPIIEVLLIALVISAVGRAVLLRTKFSMFSTAKQRYLVMMTLVTYFFWFFEFDTYRYLVPIEMLSYTLIFVTLQGISRQTEGTFLERRHFVAVGTVAIVVVCLVTEQPMNWGRSAWAGSYFSASIPKPLTSRSAAFLMYGGNPDGYIVPFFPQGDYFAQIAGNMPPTPHVSEVIKENIAPFRDDYMIWKDPVSISRALFADRVSAQVGLYGLAIDWSTCGPFAAKVGAIPQEFHVCKLRSVALSDVPPVTTVLSPLNGARIRGREPLAAIASSPAGLRRVVFSIGGQGRATYERAVATFYGWLAVWNSESIPNGVYTVQSIAYGQNGRTSTSKAVRVDVDNPK